MSDKINRQGFLKNYLLDLFEGIDTAFGDELSSFAGKFPELVRPPGAGSEKEFLEQCSRCGACVKACPFFALAPQMQANEFDLGTPALRTGQSWCRLCGDFPCINACGSGALSMTRTSALKKIATVRVAEAECLRTTGTTCDACAQKCAQTAVAISFPAEGAAPVIDHEKCSGCGACLVVCPAYPEPVFNLFRK